MAEQAEEEARRKRSFWLIFGGVASLTLPLLGVLYLRHAESRKVVRQSAPAGVFERREGEQRISLPSAPAPPAAVVQAVVVTPAAAAAAPDAPARGSGSSLDFVKGGGSGYYGDQAAAPPPAPAPSPAPEPAESYPPPAYSPPPAAAAAPARKTFAMPRLNPGKGFSSGWNSRASARPMAGAPRPGAAAAAGGSADVQSMLQNLPPGAADNPEVRKMLQSR